MTEAVLFDMGGTLDGDGLHWLDRFVDLYADAGVHVPRDEIRAAFDEAERRALEDDTIASAGLDEMVGRHVAWQLLHLGIASEGLRDAIAGRFVDGVRRASS